METNASGEFRYAELNLIYLFPGVGEPIMVDSEGRGSVSKFTLYTS